MLHRLTLRVLPRLTMAVTADTVRTRKRLVMFVAGLGAFAGYRLVKQIDSLSDPLFLLVASGLLSASAALAAYRAGRQAPWSTLWNEDRGHLLAWLVGWIGFVYGVQLSLMVLALLKVIIRYDFFQHPDGPAMMAIVIACTSVSRDAFEIGHVRSLQRHGDPVLTFPDGSALRSLLREQPGRLLTWSVLPALSGVLLALALALLGDLGRTDLAQLAVITLVAGSVAVWAYLAGGQREGSWGSILHSVGWSELFRFWWWPGLAFAATYYLVILGGWVFVLQQEPVSVMAYTMTAGAVAGMMALYGYYLGYRRHVEDRVHQTVPASLLRCPFVMGILTKARTSPSSMAMAPAEFRQVEGKS